MNSKYIKYLAMTIITLGMVSCVDDFQDANPARALDGPAGIADAEVADYANGAVLGTDTGGNTYIYVNAGGTVTYSIRIVDAPGRIDSVSYVLSNSVSPDDLGTVSNITFDAAESGTVSLTYTAGTTPGDENITITVWDGQDTPIGQTYSAYQTLRVVNECWPNNQVFTSGSANNYSTLSSGIDGVTGNPYTDLAGEIRVYLRPDNTPGTVRFSDGSFGLYAFQGYSGDFINVEICDGNIVGTYESAGGSAKGAASAFTYSGTLNADGSMNITWSTVYGDTGTTVVTPI